MKSRTTNKANKIRPFTLHNEMAMAFPEKFDIGTIYHYTTSSVAQLFLDEKKAMLYSTWARALNDEAEFTAGIEYAVSNIAEEMHLDEEVYSEVQSLLKDEPFRELKTPWVTSFSKSRDLLSQWVSYTDRKKGGFSIGFSFQKFEALIKKIVTEKRKKYANKLMPYTVNLLPCFYLDYTSEEAMDDVRKFLHFLFVDYMQKYVSTICDFRNPHQYAMAIVSFIYLFASLVKHSAFKSESEYRLVVQMQNESMEKNVEIIGDKPRVRVSESLKGKEVVDLISELWTSPHGDTQVLKAVGKYLIKKSGRKIDLFYSNLPFNGR